ncbi:VWA domain-containing protein [Nocardia stercoris]|uniref:VWA domain-containing protein n=1 Tax=Nocardia stercoris TaxID=2483361 RepID=UPI001F2DC818|nr:VWA domain-containing protein [Nocardia stercoris]
MTAVLVVSAGAGAWWLLYHRPGNPTATPDCADGPITVSVTVDPAIAAPVQEAAQRYNASKPVARDRCATVTVTARPSAAMVAGFTAPDWDAQLGPEPALWIPDSTRSITAVRVPGLINGTPVPVATSPIALAVPAPLRQALTTANTGWGDLPALQQGSLDALGLPGWGGLRLTLPPGDSSTAAAAAVGAATAATDPLTDDAARSAAVVGAISRLAGGAPQAADTGAALTAAGGPDVAHSPVHAAVATAQQITAHGGLAAYVPAGSAPVADYPAALMTGRWADNTQNLLAGQFADFLRTPQQQLLFTGTGFGAATPDPAAVPTKAALDQVNSILAKPSLGVRATILIDTSAAMATTDGTATRLAATAGAIESTMDTLTPDSGLGIWVYGHDPIKQYPYQTLAATADLSTVQRATVAGALRSITTTGAHSDHSYPSLAAAYNSAVTGYASGRTNSVLLITSGPNDDSDITGQQLLDKIAAAAAPGKPVRIDIIAIGAQDTATMQTLAKNTGGTYTRVPGTDDPAFGTAVAQALTER